MESGGSKSLPVMNNKLEKMECLGKEEIFKIFKILDDINTKKFNRKIVCQNVNNTIPRVILFINSTSKCK
jgi:hypothetical protein